MIARLGPLGSVLPAARRGVAFELALYRGLGRWVTRRLDIPPDATAFGYVGAVAVLLWAFIVVSAVELVVLHLILPWDVVRIVADVLGVWGLVWMLGLMGSLNVYPHLVTADGLRLRNGGSLDITVPWNAVASVGPRERSRDRSRTLQVDRPDDGGPACLNVVVGSRTNVDIELTAPLEIALHGVVERVARVRLCADDPRGLAHAVRHRIADAARQVDVRTDAHRR